MRIIKTFIIMFLFVSTLQAFEKDKATSIYREKLIIADFKNQSEYKFLGKSLTDELSVLFAETKRFDIIEREKLADILKEQELQLSGIVNPEDAVSVGKLVGAKYIIFGSITGASVSKSVEKKTKTVTKKENGKKVTKKVKYYVTTWTAKVHLAARLIDIETGKVLLGKRVTGRASKSIKSDNKNDYVWIVENVTEELKGDKSNRKKALLLEAKNRAAKSLVIAFLKEFPLTGYIVSKKGKDYIVDLGTENGLNSRVNLKVLGKPEKIKHPVTGEIITVNQEDVGYLQVLELRENSSVAKVVKGDSENIVPGLKVEVVDPVFVWNRALMSFAFPGLGQIAEKRWLNGIVFFITEGLCFGSAVYLNYLASDENLSKEPILDTTKWSVSKGDVYDNIKNSYKAGMWTMIILGSIIHIWDTVNAGYPAEKNKIFVNADNNDSYFAFGFSNNEYKFKYQKIFRF